MYLGSSHSLITFLKLFTFLADFNSCGQLNQSLTYSMHFCILTKTDHVNSPIVQFLIQCLHFHTLKDLQLTANWKRSSLVRQELNLYENLTKHGTPSILRKSKENGTLLRTSFRF